MNDVVRVALAARVFTVAALAALAALAGREQLRDAWMVALVASAALLSTAFTRLPLWVVATVEGAAVAVLATLAHPGDTVTPYLVIPALIAGIDAGYRGLARTIVVEFGVLFVGIELVRLGADRSSLVSAFTWLAVALGLGLVGAVLGRVISLSGPEESYRSALTLIRRLDALSDKLSSGLDAVSIAERVMEDADLEQHTLAAAVFVGSHGGVSPLRYAAGVHPGDMAWAQHLAQQCWEERGAVSDGQRLALPLLAGDETVAVIALETVRLLDSRAISSLGRQLSGHALQLQAALLFGRVREAATSQERQRIAREVHDGVAQDVASLGYLVDNLGGVLTDPEQLRQVRQLREQVTRVVGDLRRSIFDLRQETQPGTGLGESLSAYANRVAATSPMAVHVTLDEEGPRLPLDAEFELMRIAQEAMANARKHSGGSNLWLRCTVRAPYAEIEVRDDGLLPHAPGGDSHGLTIMRERAAGIGARLVVEAPTAERTGTRVHVSVGLAAPYTAEQSELIRTEERG